MKGGGNSSGNAGLHAGSRLLIRHRPQMTACAPVLKPGISFCAIAFASHCCCERTSAGCVIVLVVLGGVSLMPAHSSCCPGHPVLEHCPGQKAVRPHSLGPSWPQAAARRWGASRMGRSRDYCWQQCSRRHTRTTRYTRCDSCSTTAVQSPALQPPLPAVPSGPEWLPPPST
jgi:hypothetical protein